jgi:hypothetical protein
VQRRAQPRKAASRSSRATGGAKGSNTRATKPVGSRGKEKTGRQNKMEAARTRVPPTEFEGEGMGSANW